MTPLEAVLPMDVIGVQPPLAVRLRTLALFIGDLLVKEYQVCIGKENRTPAATFTVQTKVTKPDWYFRGRKIPFGDPENVIGTRWIGFEGGVEAEGIGIHGTTDASSIGKAVSMGCIRMKDGAVERVFEWVTNGTEVEVRE